MRLPSSVEKTPKGKIVTTSLIGERGYYENTEFQLQIHFIGDEIEIEYYGDDDTTLDDDEIKKVIKLYNK